MLYSSWYCITHQYGRLLGKEQARSVGCGKAGPIKWAVRFIIETKWAILHREKCLCWHNRCEWTLNIFIIIFIGFDSFIAQYLSVVVSEWVTKNAMNESRFSSYFTFMQFSMFHSIYCCFFFFFTRFVSISFYC